MKKKSPISHSSIDAVRDIKKLPISQSVVDLPATQTSPLIDPDHRVRLHTTDSDPTIVLKIHRQKQKKH